MFKKLTILSFFSLFLTAVSLYAQSKSAFSGDIEKFREELTAFMGPNLNPEQLAGLNAFLVKWDSLSFTSQQKSKIIDISSQLSGRLMRPVPHFYNYITALNDFRDFNVENKYFINWIDGLIEIIFSPRFSNDNIDRYIINTSLMIKENLLAESGSVKWKVKNSKLKFEHDTSFYVVVTDATLTCYAQNDSTEIYNVSGTYHPDIQEFIGKSGTVTWEKAGYQPKDVFAKLSKFTISLTKNNFTVDSVLLTHTTYFKKPILGSLTDQAISFKDKDKANFPKFVTYTKEFQIKNLYKGINYEGGLSFEGANVKGEGTNFKPAKISLYRNDTLYIKINSVEYLFSKKGLNSQETSITLYLKNDSIYHSNLGFSYLADTRQVNLFRTSNPISKSPYYSSFHNMDMYFEYLSWNMNESKIVLSRARGASLGNAEFESSSFFNADYFMRLMGMDEYHPLNRLMKFAEYYYSETFPVPEFAKWLNKPLEYVTGLCMDMANRGFIYYDRTTNEVTIKKKTKDFLDSFAKRKDYDILNIASETKAPLDNAILDLKNFDLTVNGVSGVFLSDSQRVALYPYNKQLVIGKNRDIRFDGIVDAGLFSVFGHDFSFSYDTFKIHMAKIDSIKISVETEEKDLYGNAIAKQVDNLIQLGTAELYIDKPDNKSGLKSMRQYPIINATTYSYIFYDKIPGLDSVYRKEDFYFKVDPFTYENIDHYTNEDMQLAGEFVAGNILSPMKQYLTIQEDNSLGFNMIVPEEGIEVYGKRGILYDSLSMSNKGLKGGGTLKHLTSTTKSNEFSFYPDSMITLASSFRMDYDTTGLFPTITSNDVAIKWDIPKDEWLAVNAAGKTFDMFGNGATLDGSLKLTPKLLSGTGVVNMTDSRIASNLFNFAASEIKADTADYNLKSTTTNGYSFIAENAKTRINFAEKLATFSLNTDSSVVKFPEIQYICTMTDFLYNMDTRILNMEQKGKSNTPLFTADTLLKLDFTRLDKPTFFATNNMSDTLAFSSWKGSYHLDQEYIEAENINYIHVADALIQPANGKIIIDRRAAIRQLDSALIAVNKKHILHSAKVNIESTKRYTGSAIYNYLGENKEIQQINFPELNVDTLTTSAKGYIPVSQNFMLNPAFTFSGDVLLFAKDDFLTFTGAAGIIQDCDRLTSYQLKFKAKVDPKNIMIPVSDKPRDINDNLLFSGSFINIDSTHIYPAFLSSQKSWSDVPLVNATGFLWFDKTKGTYLIGSREKLADPKLPGNLVSFDKNFCTLREEGNLNFGAKYDLVKLTSAGNVLHSLDSGKVELNSILAFDFFFSPEALKIMSDDFRMTASLKPVNLNNEFISKGMKDLLGANTASQITQEMDLFGSSNNLPKEFNFEILLNDVKLLWNESSSSFRSTGKIGIGFIGSQSLNLYVDGYVEIQRRRSGDMFDIYLKGSGSTWYYFSYFKGVMMAQAGNANFNNLLTAMKEKDRKHPEASVRVPYSYMIAVDDRLKRFLRRMESNGMEPEILTR